MRALTISRHGELDVLSVRDDLPIPELRSPTDVHVRVLASALNHLDLFIVRGLPGVTITPDWILGTDACGVVEEVGSDVRDLRPGDLVVINPGISDRTCEFCLAGEQPLCPRFRILGEHVPGLMAEHVVVPSTNLRAIPAGTDPVTAGAFTLATLTAWRMVQTRAKVQAGERVLIWGIGGGVALAALQVCKSLGAEVWVTSTSADKRARALDLGADHALDSRSDVAADIRAATGKAGVHVVIDNVGEATWEQSLRALGRRGRLVTCGATSGPMVQTDVRRLFWNQWDIMGSTMGNDTEFDAIVEELRAGRLLPPIDSVFPLERATDAFRRLDSGEQFGKVAITF